MKKISSRQIEAFIDLTKHKELLYDLLEKEIRSDEFKSMRYHDESYYNHCIALRKARNILKYIFGDSKK